MPFSKNEKVVYSSRPPMSKTSRKNFDGEFRKEIWKVFWTEIARARKTGPAGFLSRFLTEEERIVLEKRLAALYFLKRGESLRETGKKADVAKKTVIFIKRGLKQLNYKRRVYSKTPGKSKLKQ